MAALPGVRELHIGHAIVSRALFVGMREAVREMKRLMTRGGAVIYGVGTDVVEIARIEQGARALRRALRRRILCEPELTRFRNHRQPAAYLAKRFAAKEAFTKALGTGIHAPANWHGVWVANLPSGKPELRVLRAAAQAAGPARHLRAPTCR